MNKPEMIKLLSEYDTRKEVVKAAIEDETVRELLFSLVEERSKDKSLDISYDEYFREPELKRIERELDILLNSMDAISDLGEWDSQLVQPVIPSIIGFLDYEYDAINEKAAEVILHAVNKDNIELISRAIPKLLHLLDYHEYSIEGQKVDNTKSVDNAERAFQFISVLAPELLKDSIPVLIKYIDRDYPDNISGILETISNQNWELLIPILSDIIERVDKKEHILIIGNVAKYDVEIIKPAIKPLIEQLDNTEFQELSAYVLGIIAQKKVEYVQPAIPKLMVLLSSDDEWVRINAARTLRIISQQKDKLIDESTLERLYDIIDSVNLFDEIVHLRPYNEFTYYDMALNAVNSNPNDPEALKALGEVIFYTYNLYEFDFSTKSNLRAEEKGIDYFLKSAEISPTYETYQHIGKAYEFCTMAPIGEKKRQDYRKKCIYYHTKASELNPNDIYSNERISTLNHVLGNYEEAISLREDLYKKAPDDHDVSCRLASFYVEAAKRLNEEKKYHDAYNFLLKAKNIEDIYSDTRDELDQMLEDENLRAKLRSQINDLKKKNDALTKDVTKKFREVGDVAYSECITNSHDLKEDAKTKIDEILAIDTLINKSKQHIENIKTRKQKSSFLSKLGDAISSNTKLGKLKIEIYNLEKNKNSAIKDFGETLFKYHKNGEDTLSCLSDLWNDIEDIDKIISKNEDDASNIHKMLDGSKFVVDEKSSEDNEKTAKEWTYDALDLFSSNKYEEAVECCDNALNLNQENEDAWMLKITALRKLCWNSEVIECIDNPLDIYPEKSSLWIFKGLALRDLEKYDKAIVCFDKALEIDSEDESAWNYMGNTLRSLNRGDEAVTCFDKALQINPKDAISWHNKGNTLHELKRFEEAIDCYDKALEIDPENLKAWQNKGTSLGLMKRSVEAISCLNKALELDQEDTYSWIFKGFALFDLDKYDEANLCCDKALELDPENQDGLKLKARIFKTIE